MAKRYVDNKTVEITPGKKKHRGRGCLVVLIILVVIITAAVAGMYFYLKSLGINTIERTSAEAVSNEYHLFENEAEVKEYSGMITAARDNDDLRGILSDWYRADGDIMATNKVLNILVVGYDDSGTDDSTGNSDTMIIASIDRKNKKITLCSLLRDSFTYFEDSNGNEYYSKLNAAYAYGGADCLIRAVEKNYKIRIDHFAAVNFDGFIALVDAMGGITMTVTQEEAEAIEDYAKIKGVPYGENVTLNGLHALMFSRMRKIYITGDVQRTVNQRRVINSIINKAKSDLTVSSLNKIISTVAPYISTDMSVTDLMKLGTSAVVSKWYNYTVYSMEAPPEEYRLDYNGSQWMWIVDYPASAQYVQTQLYGETNIEIPEGTESALYAYNNTGY
ncbi:MAG: LCP family protein [Clostridia bacterium]|nr:LCP family protein [Clostridia bacterium]